MYHKKRIEKDELDPFGMLSDRSYPAVCPYIEPHSPRLIIDVVRITRLFNRIDINRIL